MMELRRVADQIAPSDASVLITGESGVGKEVMARYLHKRSKRAEKPYISVNCAAIPENLLESELFGHEKGAFTGAVARRIGKFEEADGGTLLLDEISARWTSACRPSFCAPSRSARSTASAAPSPCPSTSASSPPRTASCRRRSFAASFREDLLFRLNVINLQASRRCASVRQDLARARRILRREIRQGQRLLARRLSQERT